MRAWPCGVLLLAAACGGSTSVRIERAGDPLRAGIGNGIALEAVDGDVSVTFAGRTFVLRDFPETFTGTMSRDAIELTGDDERFLLTPREVRAERGDEAEVRRLDEIPRGATVVWDGDELRW